MRPARLLLLALSPLACTADPVTTETSDAATSSTSDAATPTTTATSSTTETTESPSPTSGGTTTTAPGTTSAADTADAGTTGEPVACPEDQLPPGDHTITLAHDGLMRSAIVHVPPDLARDSPTPLILNFHGLTSNAAQQQLFSDMNPLADAEGFIVAYPEGVLNSWNAGACCGDAILLQHDDVGFTRALVAELHTRSCIDPRRIYATGMSNGGFMSHRLACEAADLVAAVAPVSAVNGMATCDPERPVPLIMFNGTLDALVPYIGSGIFNSVQSTFAAWAERDGCTDDPQPGDSKGLASSERHDACEAGTRVIQWTLQGMGHCWPGQALCPFGASNLDIDANAEMWAFFQQFTLP